MPNTYTLLETVTVGAAGASSVTFNSIPQTGYTDLVVKVSARSNFATIGDTIYLEFNGSASNFTSKYLRGSGSAADSGSLAQFGGYADGASETANTFSNIDLYIPNYTSSNYKSYSVDSVDENNATTAYQVMIAGLWSNTAAINKINLALNGGRSFVQHSTFSLYGVSALGTTPTKAPKATGGSIIQTDGTYWYHAFLSSGTFTPATGLSCDVLVVAGGGAGGGNSSANAATGGGGGAGGLLYYSSQSIGASAQTVTIGAGGAGAAGTGASGNNSVFASFTATGGGYAGGYDLPNGASGGSGGGGGGRNTTESPTGGSGTAGQGQSGGTGLSSTTTNKTGGGGGGSGAGGGGATSTAAGNGGAGVNTYSSWLSTVGLGVSGYIAGGGGGGAAEQSTGGTPSSPTAGSGGSGGAGAGFKATSGARGNGTDATANTGSGGGGSASGSALGGPTTGGNGGSGVVIIRYLA